MAKWDGREPIWLDDHDIAVYVTHEPGADADTAPTMHVEIYQDHEHINMSLTKAECDMLHDVFLAMSARLEET